MNIFTTILDKLGLHKEQPAAPAPAVTPPAVADKGDKDKPVVQPVTPVATARPATPPAAPSPQMAPAAMPVPHPTPAPVPAKPAPTPISQVDVVKKLNKLSEGSGLDWKVSIVDLLKLLDIDSSREARNQLATELGCPADLMSDSAKMNTWLHKTVLQKIAENGGNIPDELLK